MRANLPTILRLLALLALAALAIPFELRVIVVGNIFTTNGQASFLPLVGLTLIYLVAVALIWRSPPAATARWRWIELSVIAALGLILRAIFWPHAPAISHDAYRYVWDAHLVLHGISPYTHTPLDASIAHLRDGVIWPNVNWPNAPTIYPPGAEIFYLIIGIIKPLNIWAMKAGIALCDIGSGLLTLALLRRYGIDLRRVVLYWMAPIPIIEFAYSAHIDALALLLTLGTLVVAPLPWRYARVAAGVLLALATLTKLYPLLFVVVLVRRRDWGFLGGLAGTMVLVYLPFFRLGLGNGGFLSTYFHQRFPDQGALLRLLTLITLNSFHLNSNVLILLELFSIALLSALVIWWRWRFGLRPEAGILALSAIWIVLAPHLFTWYVAALLPLLALNLELTVGAGKSVAPSAIWLFVLFMPFSYVIFSGIVSSDLFDLFFLIPAGWLAWDIWRRRAYRTAFAALRATWGEAVAWLHQSYSLTAEE